MSAKPFFKKSAYTKMFIAIFLGMMLTATLSIVSVKATPITITVSPTSGPVGSTITVSGENASSNHEVRVYMNNFMFMATATANATGGYSVNITVPAVPAGTYDITVLDVTTGDTNSAEFTIQPEIVLTPEEGSYDDLVTVKGYGFRSLRLITITFNETDVTPEPQPRTDGLGSFEASFNVPSMPNGTHSVTADDETNNASALFTVIPKITLTPKASGPPSTLVTVTGRGFAPSVNVTIEFDTINITNYGGIVTWIDGFFGTMFFVPDVPNGTYTVNATDETGNSATAPFVVPSPVMTLTPNITSGSSIVTAIGSGFTPNGPIILYLEDIFMVNLVDLTTGSQTLYADEYGSYEYSFIIPVVKPGVYTVVAYSLTGDDGLAIGEEVASASLTIVEDALLVDIENEIATIIIPDLGTIKANLTAINARIIGINGTVATIETDIGTIEADLTDINARLVSIDGTVATIETDLGTIQADVSDIQAEVGDIGAEVVPTGYEFGLLATILALIAAIGAWLSAILIRRKPLQLFETERPKTKPKPKKKSK